MSLKGLGCAKTQANAGHVEVSRTKWCITESNRAVLIQFDGALENCVFYILPVYEFSHSQGHSRRFGGLCRTSAVPLNSDQRADIDLCRRRAPIAEVATPQHSLCGNYGA